MFILYMIAWLLIGYVSFTFIEGRVKHVKQHPLWLLIIFSFGGIITTMCGIIICLPLLNKEYKNPFYKG